MEAETRSTRHLETAGIEVPLTVFLHESRFSRSGSRLSRKNTESVQGVKILLTFASGHGESHLIH
jgi:hypothetical protein